MLQRIQSIWLLLAATAGLTTLKLPLYGGTRPDTTAPPATVYDELTALQNIWILILTIAVSVICLVTIFLYKNRPLQMRLCVASLLLYVLALLFYYKESTQFIQGNLTLTSLLAVAVPLCIILATRGIYKDEQLIKNADRLR